jgi:hypothetical protein
MILLHRPLAVLCSGAAHANLRLRKRSALSLFLLACGKHKVLAGEGHCPDRIGEKCMNMAVGEECNKIVRHNIG